MPRYVDLRPRIHTGDAILWKGHGLISKMILKFTPFSHASLVVRMKEYAALLDRVFLVEALSEGLRFTLLSERLENYKGEAYWMSVGLSLEQIEKSRAHALVECGKCVKYDYHSLLKNAVGKVSSDATSYFCSEFVWINWVEAGVVAPLIAKVNKAPRPGDLLKLLPESEIKRIEL